MWMSLHCELSPTLYRLLWLRSAFGIKPAVTGIAVVGIDADKSQELFPQVYARALHGTSVLAKRTGRDCHMHLSTSWLPNCRAVCPQPGATT